LSAVLDCLFDIFAATIHIGGRCIIRNLRTRHAMLTGTVRKVAVISGVARFFIGAWAEKSKWSPVIEIVNFKKIAFAEFPYIWLKNVTFVECRKPFSLKIFIFPPIEICRPERLHHSPPRLPSQLLPWLSISHIVFSWSPVRTLAIRHVLREKRRLYVELLGVVLPSWAYDRGSL
jgi:hypothetical protein